MKAVTGSEAVGGSLSSAHSQRRCKAHCCPQREEKIIQSELNMNGHGPGTQSRLPRITEADAKVKTSPKYK